MMVMAAALAKLIFASVMMTSKFWWRATTWQSDDWFQMQGSVKRGVVRLEGRSRTKRPRLAGCKGRGRWRRVCSNAHLEEDSHRNGVNRRSILTPYRRPTLTPLNDG